MPTTIINGVAFTEVKFMIKMTINPEALTRLMYTRGLTMKDLNALAKLSPNTLTHAIKKQRKVSPTTAAKVAKALNCSPLDFLQEMPAVEKEGA